MADASLEEAADHPVDELPDEAEGDGAGDDANEDDAHALPFEAVWALLCPRP